MTIANTSRPAAGRTDEAANFSTQRAIEDYPGVVKVALRDRETITPIMDRQYEAALREKGSIRVRAWGSKWTLKTDWAGGAYAGLTGSTASAVQTPYTRSELITWGEEKDELSISLKEQELAESPMQVMVRSAQGIGEVAGDAADLACYTEFLEEDLSNVPQDFVQTSRDMKSQTFVAGLADGGTAAAKGSGTDYYDANGRRHGSAEESGLFYVFDDMIRRLFIDRKMGNIATATRGMATVIFPIGLQRELVRQTKDFQADILKTDYIDGRERQSFLGRFNVLTSQHVTTVQANKDTGAIVNSGGVLHWPVHVVFTGAGAYAERFTRVKVFDFEDNQLGDDMLIRYQRQRLQWIADARYVYRVMFRAEA